jgi:hypothetical protein
MELTIYLLAAGRCSLDENLAFACCPVRRPILRAMPVQRAHCTAQFRDAATEAGAGAVPVSRSSDLGHIVHQFHAAVQKIENRHVVVRAFDL